MPTDTEDTLTKLLVSFLARTYTYIQIHIQLYIYIYIPIYPIGYGSGMVFALAKRHKWQATETVERERDGKHRGGVKDEEGFDGGDEGGGVPLLDTITISQLLWIRAESWPPTTSLPTALPSLPRTRNPFGPYFILFFYSGFAGCVIVKIVFHPQPNANELNKLLQIICHFSPREDEKKNKFSIFILFL